MRKGAEHQVNIGKINIVNLLEYRQIKMAKERKYLCHGHARLAIARQSHNFHHWMGRNQPDEFRPGVARRPQYRDFVRHI